ncbi:MAG: beta-ketoacyl-ACP synthase III [Hyphomicrobiaceae bacterium]|nr:beta-ketoacyl-ACP synthase III [Hyphomicrobiaceae bacterium]
MSAGRGLGVAMAGFGHYAPDRVVSNGEIETRLGLEPGFIEGRTGILERRWVRDGEALTDIAAGAGRMALERSGIDPRDIGLLLLATSTPDHLLPPSGPLLAHRLGLDRAGAIDMAGACAGFLYALSLGDAWVRANGRAVLIVAANILSRRINMAERASAILFSDAAGAVVLVPSSRAEAGIVASELTTDGSGYGLITIPAGGSRKPFSPGLDLTQTLMTIADGRAVFQKAVAMMVGASREVLDRGGVKASEIAHFVPHQANSRIIEATRTRLCLTPEQTLSTVAEFANSSAATIPFTLSSKAEARGYAAGDRVLLCAAGAGLTGGAILVTL